MLSVSELTIYQTFRLSHLSVYDNNDDDDKDNHDDYDDDDNDDNYFNNKMLRGEGEKNTNFSV